MANCIFCGTALDRSTKPEHILLNALGGRKTTTEVICSNCNNRFGSGIDNALASQAEVIRNILRIESGTGNHAPKLTKVKAGTDVVNLCGDGTLEIKQKRLFFPELPDGCKSVQLNAGSLEQIAKFIPNIAAKLRITEADARSLLLAADVRKVERTPDPIHFDLTFGGQEAIRSTAKACLVLWALKVGNDEVRSPAYQAARDFVIVGSDDFYNSRTALDTRLPGIGDKIAKADGQHTDYVRHLLSPAFVGR